MSNMRSLTVLLLAASVPFAQGTAVPTSVKTYPEVIPGPGLPSLASLALTSAELNTGEQPINPYPSHLFTKRLFQRNRLSRTSPRSISALPASRHSVVVVEAIQPTSTTSSLASTISKRSEASNARFLATITSIWCARLEPLGYTGWTIAARARLHPGEPACVVPVLIRDVAWLMHPLRHYLAMMSLWAFSGSLPIAIRTAKLKVLLLSTVFLSKAIDWHSCMKN